MSPTRSLFAFTLALLMGTSGCDRPDPDPKPKPPEPEAPEITVEPQPGYYDVFALAVTVSSIDGVELTFALDRDPNPEKADWSAEPITARLVRDAAVRVLARDAEGNLWGPYSFEYRLAKRDLTGSCQVAEPAQRYFGPAAPIPLEVTYSLPTALAAVELRIGGATKASFSSVAQPRGIQTLELPPLGTQGAYDVQCAVTAPENAATEGNVVTVYVDATPPVAAWQLGEGWSPPTHFKLQASDLGGAQLARAELCNPSFAYCVPMQSAEAGSYVLATAFLQGTATAFEATARVYDGAGNSIALAAPAVSAADFPSALPPYVHPITLVVDPGFDLDAFLTADGQGTPAEVRALDFTPLTGAALSLAEGWNEFLFRPAGQPSWQTFGVYRAGVAIELPARAPGSTHDWLVFASNGTLPVLQAELIARAPVTAPAWTRAWFDVPHLVFAEDLDANGLWDDAEPYYYVPATETDGAWVRRGRPFAGALTLAAQTAAAATQTADFACAGCTAGKTLRYQRRGPDGTPLGRHSLLADLSSAPVTAVTFSADAGDTCLFFWDEDQNRVPNGNEPRAIGPCTAASFSLAQAGTLGAAAEPGAFTITGMPYGGAVTGYIDVRDAASRLLARTPLGARRDLDGRGTRRLPYAGWPATLRLWSANAYAEIALPASPSPSTTTITVDVKNEIGEAVTAAAVEARSGPISDFRIYDTAVSAAAHLAYDPQYRPRLRARLDGHLSEWAYGDAATVSVRVISPAGAGRVSGRVRDAAGLPVSGAVVSWDADPYTAQSMSGADGGYTLPALGDGKLGVTRPGDEAATQHVLSVTAGGQANQDVVLPIAGAGVGPAGLLTTPRATGISGPSPATLYTDAFYAWSPLAAGAWSLLAAPNLQRRFVTPGALPGVRFENPAWLYFPWSTALLESDLEMRCGARLQTIPFGAAPLIDSPCWEWYADWNGTKYYLGRPHHLGGVPNAGLTVFYAEVFINGATAPFTSVVLRDLLFNRAITAATDAFGRIHVTLPHGFYRAETQLGGVFRAGAAPALFPVSHVSRADSRLVYP